MGPNPPGFQPSSGNTEKSKKSSRNEIDTNSLKLPTDDSFQDSFISTSAKSNEPSAKGKGKGGDHQNSHKMQQLLQPSESSLASEQANLNSDQIENQG